MPGTRSDTVTVSRAALATLLDPTTVPPGSVVDAVAHLRDRLDRSEQAAPGTVHPALRFLAGPLSWWQSLDAQAAQVPAHQAALDGVQAGLRASFDRAEVDPTDPVAIYAALVVVAYLRIDAQLDAHMGRIETAEAAAIIDATNAVGAALSRWVTR